MAAFSIQNPVRLTRIRWFPKITMWGLSLLFLGLICSCGRDASVSREGEQPKPVPGLEEPQPPPRAEEAALPEPAGPPPDTALPAPEGEGGDTLITAVREGEESAFKALMAGKVPVSARDAAGRSALHWAALKGRRNMADALIKAGAGLEEKDSAGRTPLHLAARAGAAEVARLLLDAGAAPDARDGEGYLPVELASAYGPAHKAYLLLDGAMERLQEDPGRGTVRAVAVRYMQAMKAGDASLLRELSVPGTPEPLGDLAAPQELVYTIQQTDLFEDGAIVAGVVEQPDWPPMRFVMALKPHGGTWRVLGTSLWVEE